MIRAILIEKGVVEEVVLVKTVADTQEEIKSAILEACQDLDMLITSGGVSMGAKDLVKPFLEENGDVLFG